MKITKSRLKQIIKEETESDDRLLDAIRDLADRGSSDPDLVRAIKKLSAGLDDLDLSVDFLSAAMLDVDPLSIAGAQSALGRAASPAKRRPPPPKEDQPPPPGVEEIIRQELEAVLNEKSKEADPCEKPIESPLAEDEDDSFSKAAAEIEKKGTEGVFTAKAKKASMGVQAYADKVLAKGSEASTKTKRQAAFAKGASAVARNKKK